MTVGETLSGGAWDGRPNEDCGAEVVERVRGDHVDRGSRFRELRIRLERDEIGGEFNHV
jgi:hypothetical protein